MYNQSHNSVYDYLNCFYQLSSHLYTVSAILKEYLLTNTLHLIEAVLGKNIHKKGEGEKDKNSHVWCFLGLPKRILLEILGKISF